MIFLEKPSDFNKQIEVVGCFLVRNGKILLLKRSPTKSHPGTWGVPAGKVEPGENTVDTAVREICEESGINLKKDLLKHYKSIFVRYQDFDFIYHIFSVELESDQKVVINEAEHVDFKWLLPLDALRLNLIPDEDLCIKMFFNLE